MATWLGLPRLSLDPLWPSKRLVSGRSCPSKPQAKVPWQHMDPSCGIKQLGMTKLSPKVSLGKQITDFFFAAPGSTLTHITMKFGKSVSAFPMESGSSNQPSHFFYRKYTPWCCWSSSGENPPTHQRVPKSSPGRPCFLYFTKSTNILRDFDLDPSLVRWRHCDGAMVLVNVSWELSWLCLKMETLHPNF